MDENSASGPNFPTIRKGIERRQWRFAGLGLIVLFAGLLAGGLLTWVNFYRIEGACIIAGVVLGRMIGTWATWR